MARKDRRNSCNKIQPLTRTALRGFPLQNRFSEDTIMKNEYFEKMRYNIIAYEKAKENGENPVPPYNAGQTEAVKNYFYGGSLIDDEIMVGRYLWDEDIPDFIATLRKAGIKSIVLTDNSTALMRMMHSFEAVGCKLEGLCKVKEKNYLDGKTEISAIRFRL